MRSFRCGAAALIVWLVCSGAAGAQQPDGPAPQDPQPRNEALPPPPPPPSTIAPAQSSPSEQRLEQLIEQADDGFVPISELPPEEQLPAAPMLVAAYSVVVLGIFTYLLSLSRRLAGVKQEIARLELETKRTGRS